LIRFRPPSSCCNAKAKLSAVVEPPPAFTWLTV